MLENVCYHRIDCNTVQLSFIDDQKVDSSLIVGVRLSVRFSIWASSTKILMLENVCYHRIDCNTVQLSFIDDQKVDSSLIVGVCQCKIRLFTEVYMFSLRRSRLLNTLVCIVYVSM